MFINIVGL